MVERQPSKLNVAGSRPVSRLPYPPAWLFRGEHNEFELGGEDIVLSLYQALIAQLVEHFLGKEEVTGSNPVEGSTFHSRFRLPKYSHYV